MEYKENSGQIQTEEPDILSQPVTEFVQYMLDRLSCFTEEVTAFALQTQMPEGISITEQPESKGSKRTNGGKVSQNCGKSCVNKDFPQFSIRKFGPSAARIF
jgi:hypothetical protein